MLAECESCCCSTWGWKIKRREGGGGSWKWVELFFSSLFFFYYYLFCSLSLFLPLRVCCGPLLVEPAKELKREREREVNWMSTERGQSALSSAPVHTRPSTVHSLSATTFFIRNISRVSAISFSFSIYRDRQQIDCLPTNENVLFLKISTRRVTCITFAVWTNQDDPDVSAKFVGTKSSKKKKREATCALQLLLSTKVRENTKKKFCYLFWRAIDLPNEYWSVAVMATTPLSIRFDNDTERLWKSQTSRQSIRRLHAIAGYNSLTHRERAPVSSERLLLPISIDTDGTRLMPCIGNYVFDTHSAQYI